MTLLKILITGITGLIGKEVLSRLLDSDLELQITALIRPDTDITRFKQFKDQIRIEYIDLADLKALLAFLSENKFDVFLLIGALRGGRKASKDLYYRTNVQSTEQFISAALKQQTRLIFCSSVGVFGAIPQEMPANNETEYKEDNYYHYTKIACEKLINKAILRDLDALILRPSITYGNGDHGFPAQLVKLVDKSIFPVSNKSIWMHLCHIDTIATAFVKAVSDKSEIKGKAFNIADLEPVRQSDLVNFIYRQLYNKNYPGFIKIDNNLLRLGEKFARMVKNELWTSRFELISHSWFYQVHDAYEALDLPQHYTIPDLRLIIDNYKQNKRH